MAEMATTEHKTAKRGGKKYALPHVALVLLTTFILTISAILLIVDYHVSGVLAMFIGVAVAYFATRFS